MAAKFDVRNFAGLDRTSDSALQERNFAWAIYDAKVWDGTLRNFPCPEERCQPGGEICTIIPFKGCPCFTATGRFNYATDCDNIAFTEETGGLRVASDICAPVVCPFNLPCPGQPPLVAPGAGTSGGTRPQPSFSYDDPSEVCADNAPDDDPDFECETCSTPAVGTNNQRQLVSYMYTHVYQIGSQTYETAPSPVSDPVHASGTVDLFTPPGTDGCYSHTRLYRVQSGTHRGAEQTSAVNSAVMFIGVAQPDGSFVDQVNNMKGAPASPLLLEHGAPPADLTWLSKTDSGVYAGLSGMELWYTYPGALNTWGKFRRRKIDKEWGMPLAMVAYKNNLVVLTDKRPVWYTVALSETGPKLTAQPYTEELPLIAEKTITVSKIGVHYFSNDGVVVLNGGDSRILSSHAFNLDQWDQIAPESGVATTQGNAMFMSTSVDAFLWEFDDGLFADNPRSELIGLDFDGAAIGATAAARDGSNILWAKDGTVYQWDRSKRQARRHSDLTPLGCAEPCCEGFYRSALEDENRSQTYTAAEVHFGHEHCGNWAELSIYRMVCNRPKLVCRKRVTNCEPFRVRGCIRHEDWFFELKYCGHIKSLTFATSFTALRGDARAQ